MLLWARERFLKKVATGLKINARQNIIPSENIPMKDLEGVCGRQVRNTIRLNKIPVLQRMPGIATYAANNTTTVTTVIVEDCDDSLWQ